MSIMHKSLIIKGEEFKSFLILIILLLTSFNILFTTEGIVILIGLVYCYLVYLLSVKTINFIMPSYFFILWLFYATGQMFLIEFGNLTVLHYQVIIIGLILIWFMTNIISSISILHLVYKLWGMVLLLTILIAWWEIFTGNHIVNLDGRSFSESSIATVNFYNPNNYSFFLSVCFPVVFYWIERLGKFYKIIGIFMFLSTFFIIYSNGSRISLLVLIILLLFALIKMSKSQIKILLPIFIIGMFCILYFYDYILAFIELLTVDNTDESLNIRSYLYDSALNISLNYPFGVGPGNLEEFMPILGANVHNFWLEILVNYGFIVFLGIILFFATTLYRIVKVRHIKELRPVLKPVFLSILIFIPTSIAPSSIFTFGITWFIFGIMVVSTNLIKKYQKIK